MALRNADRVKETSTTTGTGTYSLDGAAPGFQTFVAGVGNGNYCHYVAENGTDWEVGIGLVTDAAPDTLARTVVFQSSNGDAAVSWGAGTKNIFCAAIPSHNGGSAFRVMPIVRRLSVDHSISSTTATEVTGLEITNLQPGTYVATYYLIVQSDTATTGVGIGINFTGTAARQVMRTTYADSGGLSTGTGTMDDVAANPGNMRSGTAARTFTTTAPNLISAGVSVVTVDIMMTVVVIIEVTAAGNLEIWHSSETAAATRIESGSSVVVQQVD